MSLHASCVCMRIQCLTYLTYPHSTKPSEAKLVGAATSESNGGNTVRSEHLPNPYILISLTRGIMGYVQDYFKKQIQKSRNPEDMYI